GVRRTPNAYPPIYCGSVGAGGELGRLPFHLMIRRFSGAAGALGWYPSLITSKSLAVNELNAGFNTSLLQRTSYVPLTYRSDPLSATMSPSRCMGRNIFCISGV